MANPENIVGKGFDKRPENRHVGRPPGQKNRSTVLREIYETVINGKLVTGEDGKLTVEQAIMNSLVRKAIEGDIPAIKESQDSIYGKLSDKTELSGPNGGAIPTKIEINFVKPK